MKPESKIWPQTKVLEQKLSEKGFLFAKIEIQECVWNRSHHARLVGTDDSGKERYLFLKRYKASQPVGQKECLLYERLSPTMNIPVAPICRATWIDEDADSLFIILDDLSTTHFCPGSPRPDISEEQLISVVELYADFHAFWWGKADRWLDFFQKNTGLSVSHDAVSESTIMACERFFLEECIPKRDLEWENEFSAACMDLMRSAILLWSIEFRKRCKRRDSLTLIHGDAHLGNVLAPNKLGHSRPFFDRLGRIVSWDWRMGYRAIAPPHKPE